MSWTDHPSGSPAATGTPPPAASPDHLASARELLVRTAELPDTKRELLHVLSEYRTALFTFAVATASDGRGADRA